MQSSHWPDSSRSDCNTFQSSDGSLMKTSMVLMSSSWFCLSALRVCTMLLWRIPSFLKGSMRLTIWRVNRKGINSGTGRNWGNKKKQIWNSVKMPYKGGLHLEEFKLGVRVLTTKKNRVRALYSTWVSSVFLYGRKATTVNVGNWAARVGLKYQNVAQLRDGWWNVKYVEPRLHIQVCKYREVF